MAGAHAVLYGTYTSYSASLATVQLVVLCNVCTGEIVYAEMFVIMPFDFVLVLVLLFPTYILVDYFLIFKLI